MARYLELAFFVIVTWFAVTQIILPALVGAPLFPMARYRRKFKKAEAVQAKVVGQSIDEEITSVLKDIEAEKRRADIHEVKRPESPAEGERSDVQ